MNIKGIYDQVKLGGFTNPLAPAINSALATITPISLGTLTEMAEAQALAASVPAPNSGQLSAAFNALQSASINANSMLSHSNIISGVDKASGMTITSIAKLGLAAKTIEQFNGCEFSQSVMGSLQNSAKIINDTTEVVRNIEQFLTNIPGFIDQIPDIINAYSTKILNQITSDVEALAQAKIIVINNSIASALVDLTENECMSEIFASIMTQPLKNEVTKVTAEIKATKLKSIGG